MLANSGSQGSISHICKTVPPDPDLAPTPNEVGVSLFEKPARNVNDDLHPSLVGHIQKLSKALRVQGRIFVSTEEALRVVPFFVQLNQADTLSPQTIQFLFIPFADLPWLLARIFTKVVRTLARQVPGYEMLAHASMD